MPIFLSFPLNQDTPAYGGETGSVVFERIRSIEKGDTSNNLLLRFPNHIGTHIDFPFHFDNNGKTSDAYSADFWIFKQVGFIACTITELPKKISELPGDIEILIVRTGFGKMRGQNIYWAEQPVVPAEYASMLRNAFPKLRVFGFDMISLTSKLDRTEGKKAHISFLLENEILVVEDMNLENLRECPETVVILPLQISNADGAPCSIIAY